MTIRASDTVTLQPDKPKLYLGKVGVHFVAVLLDLPHPLAHLKRYDEVCVTHLGCS